MIVRIFGERQYRLDDEHRARLDELDDATVDVVTGADEAAFRERFAQLLDFVRSHGNPLADDELVGSDFFLPPADLTLSEAQREFTGEGLIPD